MEGPALRVEHDGHNGRSFLRWWENKPGRAAGAAPRFLLYAILTGVGNLKRAHRAIFGHAGKGVQGKGVVGAEDAAGHGGAAAVDKDFKGRTVEVKVKLFQPVKLHPPQVPPGPADGAHLQRQQLFIGAEAQRGVLIQADGHVLAGFGAHAQFAAAAVEPGLPFEVCNLPEGSPLSAFEAFLKRHILESDHPLDGIFCGNDAQAWQVVHILRAMGRRVPEDVQVIGFDGTRMFGNLDYVCSTIVQPVPDLAETAVNMVLSNDFTGLPPLVCLPVRYQPGGTTRDGEGRPGSR